VALPMGFKGPQDPLELNNAALSHEIQKPKRFEKYKTVLIKMFPLGKNPGWGSGHGHLSPWSWS